MDSHKEIPISATAASDVGMVREQNEDAFLVRLIKPRHRGPFGIRAVLVVADGMGGHVGGREASRTAVRLVDQLFDLQYEDAQVRLGGDIVSFITGMIHEANARVHKIGRGDYKAPGTTFTGAFIVDNQAFIGHIGDSRAYQIRNDEIVPLSEDHSYVGHLVREGKLSPEEAKHFPQKNVLMRSLGTEEVVEVDEPREAHLMDGDILFLCTDGLWDLISDKEIVQVVQGRKDLAKACAALIRLANARGGHDNITIAVARFGRFIKGRAASLAHDHPDIAPASGRWKGIVVSALLVGGVLLLSALLILIVSFILNELSILKVPIPFDALRRLIAR